MNAYPPRRMQRYGYDGAYSSFQNAGVPIFGYDALENWFTASNNAAVRGTAIRFFQSTAKERDSESGLDFFGARCYGSALGRFASADWSATVVDIPYAELDNPQTLNLYAYVTNSPLAWVDVDGHGASDDEYMVPLREPDGTSNYTIYGFMAKPKKKAKPKAYPEATPLVFPADVYPSIYGNMFENRPAKSGAIFHQAGYSAALLPKSNARAVPMHTRLRLTHGRRSVVVDVNDIGAGAHPGGRLRVIDLTRAAASYVTETDLKTDADSAAVGMISVRAEIVSPDTPLGPDTNHE